MTREEAIRTLQGIREEAGASEDAVCYVGSDEDIKALDMAIEALQAEPKTEEWIPCSERLPNNKTYVLTTIQVSGRQPHVRSGFYHDGFFHNDNGDTWRATDRPLKAWMPLPKPYGEESEVEE